MANHTYCNLRIYGEPEELQAFYEENKGEDRALDFFKATPPVPEGENKNSWHVDQWGTKWNACDSEHDFYSVPDEDDETFVRHYLHYRFYTAWCEPYGWFKLAAKKYPHLEFTMEFEDEAWLHCGEHEAFNGVVDYNKYEYGDPEFEERYKRFEGEEEWEEFVKEQEGNND